MARIRTIKPEFWLNETIARIPEHARLLAIALLNHSDDKGYFLASPALVRASCFPFDEHSQNVLGSLQELSKIGYIEVRECQGKAIGRVVKFSEHQRIDKPQKSKLEPIFWDIAEENCDSKNVPGTFQESSQNVPRLERKGKERNMEQGKEKDICFSDFVFPIPLTLDTPDFREAWNRRCNFYFVKTNSKMDSIKAQTELTKLSRRGVEKAIKDIDHSIEQDVFKTIYEHDKFVNSTTKAEPRKIFSK